MRRRTLVVLLHLILSVGSAAAQETAADQPTPDSATAESPRDVTSFLEVNASEWMVTGGPAIGIVVFNSARGHRYMLQTVSWGRILSGPRGPGALRGQFEWAFEAVPIYGQFAPTDTYGIGFSPLVWRWNFEPRGRVATYGELAGGGLWTTEPVPVRTTTANFTAHAAYGFRYFLRPQQALVVSYRFHHISNGNRLERNPGVNAHVFQIGFSYFRPRAGEMQPQRHRDTEEKQKNKIKNKPKEQTQGEQNVKEQNQEPTRRRSFVVESRTLVPPALRRPSRAALHKVKRFLCVSVSLCLGGVFVINGRTIRGGPMPTA